MKLSQLPGWIVIGLVVFVGSFLLFALAGDRKGRGRRR